jgi:lysophospholipase L1-like esterase
MTEKAFVLIVGIAALVGLSCGTGSSATQRTAEPVTGGTYIALGDSLSVGVGASSPDTTFVEIVRHELGADVELLNFGHAGDTSDDLLAHGHLDDALDAIDARQSDDDPTNDIRLITIEIGGNDLLRIYFGQVQTGICPDVEAALSKPECSKTLRQALDGFADNFGTALARLGEAAGDIPLVAMTMYNPFDFLGRLGDLGELSLDGREGSVFPEGLNDLVRAGVDAHAGTLLADQHTAFDARTAELLSSDFIHPNDAGYEVMARTVLAALPD